MRSPEFGQWTQATGFVQGMACASRPGARGFTQVELMVTIVLVAILTTLAVPAFVRLIESNTLTTAANDLVVDLNLARSLAGRQGRDTYVCVTGDCSVCADDRCASVVYGGVPSLSNGRLHSRSLQALVFGYLGVAHMPTSGSPYTGLVADLYSTRIGERNHRCIYMAAGSALSICTDSSDCGTGASNASCL